MKRFVLKAAAALLAIALCILLVACNGGAPAPSGKPLAVATIFAYYDALRAIGGPDIQPAIFLPPGSSPHEFQATAKNKETADDASLIIKNGLGLDDWVVNLSSQNKTALRLSIGDDIEAIKTHEETLPGQIAEEKDKTLGDTNPHVWLDPLNQIKAAEMIRNALIKIDPDHKAGFEQRAATYIDSIKKLDADFKAAAATFKHHEFIGFHSAYDYLARRYGLKQVASIQEIGAGGMNPAQVERVEAIINQRHIPVVFTETAFDSKQANVVVKATGVKLGVLEPLETYEKLDQTYVGLMRKNLEELKKAMQ